MDDDIVKLTYDEAIAMLPDGEYIHTFRQGGAVLIGADWSRQDMIDWLQLHPAELSGSQATAMGHGMVSKDQHGYLFIATKDATE